MKPHTEYNDIINNGLNYEADPSDFEPMTDDEMDQFDALYDQLMDEALIEQQMRDEQLKEAIVKPIIDLNSDEFPF